MTGALLTHPGQGLTLMAWVLFDDQYPIHRKVAGLSDAAFRLNSAAIFWCRRNGTNGFVSEEDLDQVCAQVRDPARFAAECVHRGTWHRADFPCPSKTCPGPVRGDGWVIHDYLEYQPDKEETEASRQNQVERKSAGGKLGNHRRWHAARGVIDPGCQWCGKPVDNPGDNPRRPDTDPSVGLSDTDEVPIPENRTNGTKRPSVSDRPARAGPGKTSDTDRIGSVGTDRYPIAPSLPIEVDVVNRVNRRKLRTDQAIDEIDKTIIREIYAATSRVIDAQWAAKIRGHILEGHQAGNPEAYVRAVIANEPDPAARFLPHYGDP